MPIRPQLLLIKTAMDILPSLCSYHVISSHPSKPEPTVVLKTAPYPGQWTDLIQQIFSVGTHHLGEWLISQIKWVSHSHLSKLECGMPKMRFSERRSSRSRLASRMCVKTWEIILHYREHSNFWWCLFIPMTFLAFMVRVYLRPQDLSGNIVQDSNLF